MAHEPIDVLWVYTCPGPEDCAVCNCPLPDPLPTPHHFFSDEALRRLGGFDELRGEWWRYRRERQDDDGTWVYVSDPPRVGPVVDEHREELVYA